MEIDNRFPNDVPDVSIELNAIIVDDHIVNCCSIGNENKKDLLIDLDYTQDNQISSASIVMNPCTRETKASKMVIMCDTVIIIIIIYYFGNRKYPLNVLIFFRV